jgi:hypothetical protein
VSRQCSARWGAQRRGSTSKTLCISALDNFKKGRAIAVLISATAARPWATSLAARWALVLRAAPILGRSVSGRGRWAGLSLTLA